MQKMIFLSAICLWAPALLAAEKIQPLNVKTGLWQSTTTIAVSGRTPIPADMLAKLTPEQRARFEAAMNRQASGTPKTRTSKSCVTKEQLTKDPFGGKEESCTRTVLSSTGSKMELREVCTQEGIKRDATIRMEALNSDNVKGSVQATVTGNGRTENIKSSFTAKWLGPVCTGTK